MVTVQVSQHLTALGHVKQVIDVPKDLQFQHILDVCWVSTQHTPHLKIIIVLLSLASLDKHYAARVNTPFRCPRGIIAHQEVVMHTCGLK